MSSSATVAELNCIISRSSLQQLFCADILLHFTNFGKNVLILAKQQAAAKFITHEVKQVTELFSYLRNNIGD